MTAIGQGCADADISGREEADLLQQMRRDVTQDQGIYACGQICGVCVVQSQA